MSNVYEHGVVTDGEAKTHALVSYLLLVIGMFTGIPMIFGVIWAMIKRSSAIGTIYHSHYTNAIRTFWWSVVWCIVGGIFFFAGVGILVWGVAWLWVCYRLINGLAKITSDVPYPL